MVTKQEFFDTVAAHLLSMDDVSWDYSRGICAYRGAGGAKCAIGVMIPDELYNPEMEGLGVTSLVADWSQLSKFIPSISLAAELQAVHDNGMLSNKHLVKADLKHIARNHGLNADVVEPSAT